jgi:NAD(P)-dependent dehydrogenase (short-subunit alcohol dehydrogenase family)
MRLNGKVAIVTGGSQGIGEAIARRFAAEGAMVAIVYSRNSAAADEVVAGIRADGGQAEAFRGDCGDVAEIRRVVGEVVESLGGVDVLVNNAGTFRTLSIEATTEAVWDEQLDLNLKGAFFCTQAVLPHLEARGGGKVINISSIAGVAAFPNCAAYCASKGGLVNLTKALAVELAPRGINVNTVAPGNVETSINAHLRGPGSEPYVKQMSDRTPTGRAFLDPKDIAGAAAYLASDDARAVHGAVLLVDDGWSA